MLNTCKTTIRKVCDDFDAEPVKFNSKTNHVHLLVNYPPKTAVSNLVNSLKGASTRILHRDFTAHVNHATLHGHSRLPSYFTAPHGKAPLSNIKHYTQQQHPPRKTERPRN